MASGRLGSTTVTVTYPSSSVSGTIYTVPNATTVTTCNLIMMASSIGTAPVVEVSIGGNILSSFTPAVGTRVELTGIVLSNAAGSPETIVVTVKPTSAGTTTVNCRVHGFEEAI